MRRRLLAAAAGVVLVALALFLVGFEDRVVDESGTTHRGRLEDEAAEGAIVLRTAEGRKEFDPARVRSVKWGLLTAFRPLAAHPRTALPGLAFHLLAILAVHTRWAVLLRGAGLRTPLLAVLRLGWIGQFAGCVLPGGIATGDVVKSLYVAEAHPGRRARAVTTVVFDRALGLVVLSAIAFLGALLAPGATRLSATRPALAVLLAACFAFLVLLFSRRLRAATGVSKLLARLPLRFVRDAGDALVLYAGERKTVALAALLALLSQSLALVAFFFYALALEAHLPLFALVVAIPVAQMVSAVPGLPGGFGMGDLAFVALLPDANVPAATALALSLTYRTIHLLIALPAGFWFLRRRVAPPEPPVVARGG